MSNNNYILKLLNFKDENLFFDDIFDENIKGINTKVIYGRLINKPNICPYCGCKHINIHGYKQSTIKIMPISGCNALLKLKKQRYICKDCSKTFIAETDIVKRNCFIATSVKQAAAAYATRKISEKDISIQLNISHNTVNRVINSFFESYIANYNYLPKVLCFDEFKSTKDAAGSMSFIFCDALSHSIIDIPENRQLHYLRKYFSRYKKTVRKKVEYIVMDMYNSCFSLTSFCIAKPTYNLLFKYNSCFSLTFFHTNLQS